MIDIYKSWNEFILYMDLVPEQLDGEKLIAMTTGLIRTREEREKLGKEAASGNKDSLEHFINSFVPMIVSALKKYESRIGYNRDVFMLCVGKITEYISNSLFLDNLEYNTRHYVDWMVRDEVCRYITRTETQIKEKTKPETKPKTCQEYIDKIEEVTKNEYRKKLIEDLLLACSSDKERQCIAFRYGLEDGEAKTFQEIDDRMGINIGEAESIIYHIEQRIMQGPQPKRRKTLIDYFNESFPQ